MNRQKSTRTFGFTLVEIMIVLICTALLMGPIFLVLRSSTRTSLKGMLRIDTTLEARRVIKQVYADLKMACFPLPYNSVYNFDDVMQVTGTPPHNSYKFYSFPIHQRLNDIFASQLQGSTTAMSPKSPTGSKKAKIPTTLL